MTHKTTTLLLSFEFSLEEFQEKYFSVTDLLNQANKPEWRNLAQSLQVRFEIGESAVKVLVFAPNEIIDWRVSTESNIAPIKLEKVTQTSIPKFTFKLPKLESFL